MTGLKTLKLMIEAGMSIREISRKTGIDRGTIKYQLGKEGIKSNYSQGKRPKDFSSSWFKGKTMSTCGYVMIKKRNHPFADKQGYVKEHRLVMEEHLGRYLSPEETVHHRNHNKSDNGIENLFLFPTDGIHHTFHMIDKYKVKKISPEEFMEMLYDESEDIE